MQKHRFIYAISLFVARQKFRIAYDNIKQFLKSLIIELSVVVILY